LKTFRSYDKSKIIVVYVSFKDDCGNKETFASMDNHEETSGDDERECADNNEVHVHSIAAVIII